MSDRTITDTAALIQRLEEFALDAGNPMRIRTKALDVAGYLRKVEAQRVREEILAVTAEADHGEVGPLRAEVLE